MPGRDRYLKAQEHARKIHSWSKQPQKGRKPPRLGGVNKKIKKQRAVQYSGAKKVELQKKLEIKIARRRLVFRRLWSLNVQLLTPCNAWAFCKSYLAFAPPVAEAPLEKVKSLPLSKSFGDA